MVDPGQDHVDHQGWMLSRTLLCLFLAMAAAFARDAHGGIRVREATLRQLAVPGRIDTLLQGADGFLWLGTTAGLFRYDGVTFQHVPDRKGRFVGVHALATTNDGVIWAATAEALLRWHGGSMDIVAAPPNAAFTTLIGSGSFVWAAGRSGLYRLRDGYVETSIPELRDIHTLGLDSDGTLWFGCERGLGRVVSGKPQLVFTDRSVISVAVQSADEVVFGTAQGGLWRWRSGAVSPVLGWKSNPDVRQLLSTQAGELWLGSGAGVSRGRGDDFVLEVSDLRLPQAPTALLIDRQNSLWIGLGTAGLAQLRLDSPFRSIDLPTPRPIFGLALDSQSLWALDPTSGVIRAESHGSLMIPMKTNIRGFSSRGLARAHDGTLWMGSLDGGAAVVRQGLVHEVPVAGPAPHGIGALYEDSAFVMWAAPTDGGLLRFDGNSLVPALQPAQGSFHIVDMVQAHGAYSNVGKAEGLVLLAQRALHVHNGLQWTAFAPPTLGDNDMRAVVADPAGGYWIAAGGAGLLHFDGHQFKRFAGQQGIPIEHVEGLALVHDAHLVLGSHDGLTVASSKELRAILDGTALRIHAARWDAWDGLPSNVIITGWPGTLVSDGSRGAYVTTNAGPVWIADVAALTPPKLPQVSIESAEVNGVSILHGTGTPPRGANRFVATFAVPTFIHAHRVHFRHRLVGVHDDWIEVGEGRHAVYPGLAPGKYTFEVQAIAQGSRPQAKTVGFSIRPQLHRSPGVQFFAAAFAAVCALTFLLFLRRQRLRARQAVDAERARMAHDLHDTLEQTLVAVGFQLQAAEAKSHDQPSMNRHLSRAQELLKTGMIEARDAVWSLHSIRSDDLASSLKLSVGEILRDSSIRFDCTVTGSLWPVPNDAKRQIERIVGEAVTNALKHARPTAIGVTLAFLHDRILVKVQDDGAGFAPENVALPHREGGHGLAGMRTRADRLGATLFVTAGPNQGTTVSLEMPRPSTP